ncbi:MAG: dihydroneopterin aldolase [Fimbriimonadaceae bacterium]|nr:dihydroneopterin aldolase [Fimbriimonadaceae bacterium]
MSDHIRLLGMQFYAHHGVAPEERELGQRFEIDVDLERDLRAAGESDYLHATVNYATVYEQVAAAMTPPCLLLEALAERIAGALLATSELRAVTVRVRKPGVPIGGLLACAEVEIRREA